MRYVRLVCVVALLGCAADVRVQSRPVEVDGFAETPVAQGVTRFDDTTRNITCYQIKWRAISCLPSEGR